MYSLYETNQLAVVVVVVPVLTDQRHDVLNVCIIVKQMLSATCLLLVHFIFTY